MVRLYCSSCSTCIKTEVRKIPFDSNFLFMCPSCESNNVLITHVKEDEPIVKGLDDK